MTTSQATTGSVTTMEHEAHNPALLHHFSDAQQQKNAASLGMWLFLVTEIMFFGGMFCAYLVYRLAHFNAFAAASQQLSIKMGAFNTAVLIVSSVTVVLAVKAAEVGKRKLLVGYLVVTVLLGLTFLVVKGFEYNENSNAITYPAQRSSSPTPSTTTASKSRSTRRKPNSSSRLFCHDRHACPAHDHRLRPF